MNTTQLAPPSPDPEATLPTSASEPQTSSQPESQEPRTETGDEPETSPAADATTEASDDTVDDEDISTHHADERETDLVSVSEEPAVEAAAITITADEPMDDDPDTRLSAPEEPPGEETADAQPAPERTDDVQPETPPAADATTETSDDTDNADNSPIAQPVDGEDDLKPPSDEPDVEAAAIAAAADNLVEATGNGIVEDSIPETCVEQPEHEELSASTDEETSGSRQETMDDAVVPDSSAQQAGHGTENGREQLPSAPEAAIQPLSDIFNSSVPQQHAEAEESPTHLQSELLADISATMEDQTDKLTRLSSALFAMDKRFTELSTSVTQLSQDLQKVSEETEQTVSWTESVAITSSLSRWFLALSIFMLLALLGGMGYLAVNQYQLMQQQSNASQAAAAATELQLKRMAEFDKRFAELVGGAIKSERETINKESVAGKVNKLRGGAAERRILRKSTGDWLIPNGKTEELVTDPEIIEALNLAFEKSGRPLITPPSLPPHKTVCILKPNGKGGTEVMLTRETMP